MNCVTIRRVIAIGLAVVVCACSEVATYAITNGVSGSAGVLVNGSLRVVPGTGTVHVEAAGMRLNNRVNIELLIRNAAAGSATVAPQALRASDANGRAVGRIGRVGSMGCDPEQAVHILAPGDACRYFLTAVIDRGNDASRTIVVEHSNVTVSGVTVPIRVVLSEQ